MEGASEESVRAAGLAVETCLKKLLGVALVLVLTSAASAQAEGFNVNSSVTFVPLPATFRTSTDTTGCPADFAGKFTLKALLTNKPASPAMPGIAVRVRTLTNGNILLDPQTDAILGGQGAVMEVPKVGQYGDGLLSPGERVEVPFVLCLTAFQPFQFFVDVSGVVTELVSINRFGTDSGNDSSAGALQDSYAISADGRYVAFESWASDLVENDSYRNSDPSDVFVRDLQTGVTTLVSINRFGTDSGNLWSRFDAFSPDGRFVMFTSGASDLVANDTNKVQDVFVRDLQTGTTTLVSVNRFGTNGGNARSGFSNIASGLSADGRFVLFASQATDLVATDISGSTGVFVRDLWAGITRLVTSSQVLTATLSADGRFVAFDSTESSEGGGWNVFVWDFQTGITTLASINRFGTNSGNGNYSLAPSLSADGRFVAFQSDSTDLVAIDDSNSGNGYDIFVRDMQLGITTMASVNRFGTSSGNGGVVNPSSESPVLSPDGRFVVFRSRASDLVVNDTNDRSDVFVRDLQTGTTTLVSVNQAGTDSGNMGASTTSRGVPGTLSADGRFVAFMSFSSDLTAIEDTNFVPGGPGPGGSLPQGQDVFVRDLQMGTTAMVSVNRSGTNGGNHNSTNPILSADGRFVVFESEASDLVGADSNGARDVFVRPVQ